MDCQVLAVSLGSEVLAYQNGRQGLYQKYQKINGRASWISASRAIWYVPEFKDWAIGNLDNIGTKFRGIASRGDKESQSPLDIPDDHWMYFATKWKSPSKSGVSIKCMDRKGKKFLCYYIYQGKRFPWPFVL